EGPGDLKRMAKIGVKRFLIGEALMRRADVEQALKVLLAGANVPQA
ncbi:MAG: indole-3-glycerol-phosphate synthase TrpC, partial [Magnetospirillum sp.]|nr:indole-3-glycerol-phosphate synthase TrpC [Magnetospirillum sp.]